jgi:RND family efflux transporter MFP subunit
VTLNEAQINVITLRPEALARLKLETGSLEEREVATTRSYGAELLVPSGRSIVVTSPVAGILKATKQTVEVGQAVKAGEPLFELLPLLTPEGRATLATSLVDAKGQAKSAQAQQEAAKIAYERAKRVFDSEAGSRRALDEATAQLNIADENLAAALARRAALEEMLGETSTGTAAPLVIKSPCNGMVRTLSALPSQQVPAGAPLFEIADLRVLWLRLPVFVGDTEQVDREAEVTVSPLTSRPSAGAVLAKPIDAPPSANPMAATVDYYYELQNDPIVFHPGQRVAAQVSLVGQRKSLVAPWAAVVYDVYGGTWVYERTGELTFARRRVVVRQVQDQIAVLESGPSAGTKVVTAGAAELFGTETGFTK